MKRLCSALNIKPTINKISEQSLKEVILKVYANDEYKFYLNSELIDVNDRFRIFNYNEVNYISKKTEYEDGINEIKLATLAKNKLNNLKIGKYQINVVEPKLISIDNSNYIITEYKGTSLQENLYSKEIKNTLSIDIVLEILEKFISLGVMYRGFLPRNTIVNNNIIYLLDWEDAIFGDTVVEGMNTLWKTNFLLNWGYFYDISKLESKMKTYFDCNKIEPKLLKYEINFGKWILSNKNEVNLRNQIFDTVLLAESKLNLINDDFYIMPNDLAHLVSDLFNSDIDVLFDISTYVLRKKSEDMFYNIICLLSNLIIDLYKRKITIQPYAILIILVLFETSSSDKIINIPSYNKLEDFLENLNNMNISLLDCYNQNFDSFKKKLYEILNKVIYNYDTGVNITELQNNLEEYIWNLKKAGD